MQTCGFSMVWSRKINRLIEFLLINRNKISLFKTGMILMMDYKKVLLTI
jgi:hypothetical protein